MSGAKALKENTTLQQLGVASHELGQNLGRNWGPMGFPMDSFFFWGPQKTGEDF